MVLALAGVMKLLAEQPAVTEPQRSGAATNR
jgi:hypothetical protein